MSLPAPGAGTSPGTSWRLVNVVLAVLALVLVAASIVFFVQARSDAGGGSHARTVSSEYAAVSKAAKDETLAFLTVDYKNMDPLIAKVLKGATGSFKKQYDGAKTALKSSATQSQSVSTGKVLELGISDLTEKSAVVFVAADSHVTNTSTKGTSQPRYYRLKLTMVRDHGSWLTSDIEFVG